MELIASVVILEWGISILNYSEKLKSDKDLTLRMNTAAVFDILFSVFDFRIFRSADCRMQNRRSN